MLHNLSLIANKPHDYKICPKCGTLNWYENEICFSCNHSLEQVSTLNETEMDLFIKCEVEYYINYQGFSSKETVLDYIQIEV